MEGIQIYHGFREIDAFLQSQYRQGVVLGLHDYYPWWASQGEAYDSGKILFVDDEYHNPNSHRIQQIFFDDNIHIEEFLQEQKMILDVRSADTWNPVENLPALIGKVCIPVNPIEAMRNKRYFIEKAEAVLCRAHCSKF